MPGKISTALVISAVLAAAQAAAKPTFPSRIPNGANVVGVDALGHVDTSGGGSLNAFGTAFDSAGLTWTKELCRADSDGDGQTNGQELGDPCCEWVAGSNEKVQWTTGVSHPGDATKKADALLWASVTCSTTTTTSTTTTAPSTTTAAPKTSATTTTSAPSAAKSSAASTTSLAMVSAVAVTAIGAIFA